MRGKGDADGVTVFACRITPAYAGKRKTARPFPGAAWDHPRLCGEKIYEQTQKIAAAGSPPPMRGKVASEKTLLIGTGITPAYAGKSLCLLRQKDDVWDHPRLCGEKMLWGRWNLYILGSPPPMRGKASGTFKSPFSSGITPAYAGKSLVRLL